jgi:hypothetical protein
VLQAPAASRQLRNRQIKRQAAKAGDRDGEARVLGRLPSTPSLCSLWGAQRAAGRGGASPGGVGDGAPWW